MLWLPLSQMARVDLSWKHGGSWTTNHLYDHDTFLMSLQTLETNSKTLGIDILDVVPKAHREGMQQTLVERRYQ